MPSIVFFLAQTQLTSGYHRRMWSLISETDLYIANSSRVRGPSALRLSRASPVHLPYPEYLMKPHSTTSSKSRFGSHELLHII